MTVPPARFETEQAYNLLQSFIKEIYPKINEYLTGTAPTQRGLSREVLSKYKVGVGRERFTDENGHSNDYDAVYFPMFAPRTEERKQGMSKHEEDINTELS